MTQPLFIKSELTFEKIAVETQLSEDPNKWPNELLDELFRQAPYVSDFDLDVSMAKVDGERGFGFGHIEASSKSESPSTAPVSQQDAAGIRRVRIPIIIKESRLQPFDVVITEDSKMLPLTEGRLRQALFRPQSFDVTSKSPGDQSLINQLFPPYRQNYGFGGGGAVVSADGKVASALSAALVYASTGDLDAFKEAMLDQGTRLAYAENVATHEAVQKIAAAEPVGEKLASLVGAYIPPTVLQLSKAHDGYVLKTAAHNYWEPLSEHIDRGEAVRRCGEKVVLAADVDGSVTVAEGEGVDGEPDQVPSELIEEPGRYKVMANDGRAIEGIAITNLVDTDGKAKPITIFTDTSVTAVQADIAGVPMGPINELAQPFAGVPAATASGYGIFITMDVGVPKATVPVNVKAKTQSPDGTSTFMAETFDGRPVELVVLDHLQDVDSLDNQLLIPSNWQWLPLGDTESVSLVGDSDGVDKMASLGHYLSSVTLRAGGYDSFSLSGPALEKIATEDKSFLSQDDALFLLAGLGADLKHAQVKMADSMSGFRPVQVQIGRSLKTAAEVRGEAYVDADKYLSSTPVFRHRLWKEASVLPDPLAVDTVLSLGFINPENVAAFIGYLPSIDDAQKRMCELLIASRMGLADVPTPALEKAIRATEEVIEGLREMAFQA